MNVVDQRNSAQREEDFKKMTSLSKLKYLLSDKANDPSSKTSDSWKNIIKRLESKEMEGSIKVIEEIFLMPEKAEKEIAYCAGKLVCYLELYETMNVEKINSEFVSVCIKELNSSSIIAIDEGNGLEARKGTDKIIKQYTESVIKREVLDFEIQMFLVTLRLLL